jgi:hypothetical protein
MEKWNPTRLEELDARKEIVMSASKIAGPLAAFAFALLILSTVLGSAIFGSQVLADWTLIASQVCIWLAASVFLGYFFHGCASEIRRLS